MSGEPQILLPGMPLAWVELTRAAVRKYVSCEYAEHCYIMLVTALAQCADEQQAMPKDVAVAFSRAKGKWQDEDAKPITPPLQVHMRATYNGEWFDYSALLPLDYDPLHAKVLQ